MNTHYTVSWRDMEGTDHSQTFQATSATGAIAAALEKIELLRNHPNLIHRVIPEVKQ